MPTQPVGDRTLPFRALRSFWFVFAVALALGFAFQGTRGLWETDEGRYTQVAMEMLRSGDYITPRRHAHHIHPTKPPMTYWAIAASVGTFGRNEWAVRTPYALAFAFATAALFGIGRRLTPTLPGLPAAVYATTALPFFAANLVTTDTFLTLATLIGVFGYVGARWPLREGQRDWPWFMLMWAGFGLAFVTKGPPGLLPLAAIVVFDLTQPQWRTRALFDGRGLLAFAVLGFTWYVAVVLRNPGLMRYLVEEEVVARVASAEHGRFPQWWGGFYVYGFTLLLGTVPWLHTLWRHVSALPVTRARWRALSTEGRFLAVWFALPFVVFMLARSRLPLYLLPLFPVLALVVARNWLSEPARLARRLMWMPVFAVVLVALKFGSTLLVNNKDMRAFAKVIDTMVPYTPKEVVFIDESPRYGLGFYLDCPTEWVGLYDNPQVRYDDTLENELMESEGKRLFLIRPENFEHFVDRARQLGHHIQRYGESHRFVIAGSRRNSDNRRD